MAELAYESKFPVASLKDVVLVHYAVVTSSDTTQPLALADYADKSVHVFGGAGAGNIVIQGSNDPRVLTAPGSAVWTTCKSTTDTDMIFAAATGGTGTIRDNFYFYRVSTTSTVTAGQVAITGRRTR